MKTLLVLMLAGAACLAAGISGAVPAVGAGEAREEPQKLALLVAVREYHKPYQTRASLDWANLNTHLDVENLGGSSWKPEGQRVTGILQEKFGFPDENVLILQDLQAYRGGKEAPGLNATRAGILQAFREHLIKQAKPGAVVVFYFAGHGQQVRDDVPDAEGKVDSDEQDGDGLDEAIVPYDYVSGKAADGAKTGLRDDHFQPLLRELTKQVGEKGNVTVVFDSCHSNTMVRGNLVARGRGWDPALDGPLPPAGGGRRGDGSRAVEGQSSPEGSGFLPADEALAAGYVMLAACQSHESAFEHADEVGRPLGGNLTYKLCEALAGATPGTRYQDLFERVKLEVKALQPLQTPNLEGKADQLLFSGQARPEPPYPRVQAYASPKVTIGAGRLHGVSQHSRYWLYGPTADTTKPANRLTSREVRVTAVELYRCAAELAPEDAARLSEAQLRGAKAVLAAQHYDDAKLKVLLVDAGDLEPALREPGVGKEEDFLDLRPTPPARGGGGEAPSRFAPRWPDHDFRITRERVGGVKTLVLRRKTDEDLPDQALTQVPEGPEAGESLRRRLVGAWRWRFLAQLAPEHGARGEGGMDVAIRIVPVEAQVTDGRVRVLRDLPEAPEKGGGAHHVLRGGDYMQIELENKGALTAYVTVLNLQPNGTIAPIFPHPLAPMRLENRIPGGKKVRLPHTFVIEEPFGTDIFKVIATPEPVDFSPLLYQAETLTRGERGPTTTRGDDYARGLKGKLGALARLLQNASSGQRDTRLVYEVEPDYWGTANVTLETRPKPR